MKRSTFFKSLLSLFTLSVLPGFGKKEEFEDYPIKDSSSFKFNMRMGGEFLHVSSGQKLKHKSMMRPFMVWKQRVSSSSFELKEYNHVMLVHLEGNDKSPVTERMKQGSLLLNEDDTFWVVIDSVIIGGVSGEYFAIKKVDGPKGVDPKSLRS